jgi:prepilin-type N-terminal cleavage/methylation domain-containing protein
MMNRGFTLLEVMIAIVLLSFLSIFTSQSISRAIRSKEKIQKDLDKYSSVRDSLKVMERDINNAFNFQDFNAKLFNLSLKERAQMAKSQPAGQPQPGQPPVQPGVNPANLPQNQFVEKYKQKVEWNYSVFNGEKAALDFAALSNVRMTEDDQVSQQAEIGYHLKSCRRRAQQNQSSNCLWRRVAPIIDDDPLKGGEETVLLENVETFSLRYLGPGKEKEWVDTWISGERGDALTKGKFPYAVEITIEVKDKNIEKDKPLRMTIVAAIRNPNNPPPTTATDPNNPNAVDPNSNGAQQGQGANPNNTNALPAIGQPQGLIH